MHKEYHPLLNMWIKIYNIILKGIVTIPPTYIYSKEQFKYMLDKENKLMVTKGERWGEGLIRRLGLTDTHYYI